MSLANRKPVYLHSSFRSGSTWLANAFRCSPEVMLFYEPFHEAFNWAGLRDLESLDHNDWRSHHPNAPPYFLEYLPLHREGGGLSLYDARMAFDWFLPLPDGHLREAEIAYLSQLSELAEGRQPVLADTRTLMRIDAIRRALGGVHVFFYRNLLHQWHSYSGQMRCGNAYFMLSLRSQLRACKAIPYLYDVGVMLEVDSDASDEVWLGALSHDTLLLGFIAFHIYVYARARRDADVVLDITRMGANRDYERASVCDLERISGVQISLHARNSIDVPLLPIANSDEVRLRLDNWRRKCCSALDLSNAERAFVNGLVDEFWHEQREYSRYTIYVPELVASHRAIVDRSENDRQNFVMQLSEACANADALRAQLASLQAEVCEHTEGTSEMRRVIDAQAASLATAAARIEEEISARREVERQWDITRAELEATRRLSPLPQVAEVALPTDSNT